MNVRTATVSLCQLDGDLQVSGQKRLLGRFQVRQLERKEEMKPIYRTLTASSNGRLIEGLAGIKGLRGTLKGRSPGSQWSLIRYGSAMSFDVKIEQQLRICLRIWQRPSIDHDMARISRIDPAQR
jgi:hypothetical protein